MHAEIACFVPNCIRRHFMCC